MVGTELTIENSKVLNAVSNLCSDKGMLLYLIKFGSHLYGTNTINSDTDYKGIFLPHIKNLVLERSCRSISKHTSSDMVKNCPDDIDIDLWSLQHWLDLLKKGDSNAIDMLFSYTNNDVLVYVSPLFEKVFNNPMDYINLNDNNSYVSYAHHQAKKYGLKGSRLHLLKSILEYVKHRVQDGDISEKNQFSDLIPQVKEKFFDETLCYDKLDKQGQTILYILGSGFSEKIKVADVIKRLETSYTKFGERAILAEKNENVDWKAISHAMRCILQVKELANTGHLVFPLKDACYLREIKSGKFTWKECEQSIADGVELLNDLVSKIPQNTKMNQVHEDMIFSCYPELC